MYAVFLLSLVPAMLLIIEIYWTVDEDTLGQNHTETQ